MSSHRATFCLHPPVLGEAKGQGTLRLKAGQARAQDSSVNSIGSGAGVGGGKEEEQSCTLFLSSPALSSFPLLSFLSFAGRGQDRPRAITYLNFSFLKTQGLGGCRCSFRRWEQTPPPKLCQGQAPDNGSEWAQFSWLHYFTVSLGRQGLTSLLVI